MQNKRLGILGGGQLGKMLIQAASKFSVPCIVVDPSPNCPAAQYATEFVKGHFNDEAVVRKLLGKVDAVTVEIEHVSLEGLEFLREGGVKVNPGASALEIIKDKYKQKSFFIQRGYPTSAFRFFENAEAVKLAIANKDVQLPAVQKATKEGYDGRGVQMLRLNDDVPKTLDYQSVVEDLIDIDYEISAIAARNEQGQIEVFQPVTQTFHPEANQVELVHFHDDIPRQIIDEATTLARGLVEDLDICGLLAVEMFVDKQGKIWINEVAPRPHNSGHLTIEGNRISQFEQHLRAVLNWPLIKPEPIMLSSMVNIVGEQGYSGPAVYEGLADILKMEGAYPHIYGKAETRPFRKMGHVTIVEKDRQSLLKKVDYCKKTLKCISQ